MILKIPDDTLEKESIHILNEELTIKIGKRSSAVVIVEGSPVSQVFVGEGSSLELVYVEGLKSKLGNKSENHFFLEAASRLTVHSVVVGGNLNDSHTVVELKGNNAFFSIKGLAVLSEKEQSTASVEAHHRAPGCTSRQHYKNILSGSSKATFNSMVHVYSGANQTDSKQLNQNLLLSDEARAYSKPELKINADDVSCNHGATVGSFSEHELFYLRSRGFSKTDAAKVLSVGFVKEITETVKPIFLKNRLNELIDENLNYMLENGVRTC